MRKLKGNKIGKRILSVVLTLGMILTMLPIADRGMTSQAAGGGNIQEYSTGSKDVVRGYLGDISELPQASDPNWKSKQVGTAQRPFFILEIVPYKEYAEMGYLIGGCEPINIHDMQGHDEDMSKILTATLGSLWSPNAAQVNPGNATVSSIFFFRDEPEGQPSYYKNYESKSQDDFWNNSDKISYNDTSLKSRYLVDVKGYYEVVKEGEGVFKVETDASGNKSIVQGSRFPKVSSDANVVWHSLNPNIDGNGDLSDIRFDQELNRVSFSQVGDRLYTVRKSTAEDWALNVIYTYNYNTYENPEVFLHDVLGLDKEGAKGYSAVVKTITPSELNAKPEWVEYADLITLSPQTHGGMANEAFAIWEKYNYFGDKATANRVTTGPFDTFDLSWNVVKAIVDKNARESTYAPLLVDSTIYGKFTDKKAGLTYQIYDFNLDPISAADRGTYTRDGYSSNVYKMLVMLMMQKPSIVRNIFWDYLEEGAGGKIALKLQNGDSQIYWSDYIFQLVEKEHFLANASKWPSGTDKVDFYNYMSSQESWDKYWDRYNYASNITSEDQIVYVQNRVYSYKGDNSIAQLFRTGSTGLSTEKDKYKDFRDYLEKDAKTREIWDEFKDQHHAGQSLNENTAPPSAALRYILGIGEYEWPGYSGVLKVLDVEPGVGVNSNYTPNWLMKDTYFYMLLPDFTGDIELTHMTMNTFVGKSEDLNSTYDLIYFGSDSNAFWKKADGSTDFIDDTMDGLLYFHMGDKSETGERKNNAGTGIRNADFVVGTADDSKDLRFPGNDITNLKANEVLSFIAGGSPVVADSKLYDGVKVKEGSNVWKLLSATGVYKTTDADTSEKVEDLVRANRKGVTFTETPALYDGDTYIDGSHLVVKFTVPDSTGYSYKFYIDENRNGKFEPEEVKDSGEVTSLVQTASCNVSDLLGLIQWRIEVYNTNNVNERYSLEGCSAISGSSEPGVGSGSGEKKHIKVLQIEPASGVNNADLQHQDYVDLYKDLKDFTVEVDKITWDQFENYFVGTGFSYDMGSPIVEGVNPRNKAAAESVEDATGNRKPNIGTEGEKLSNYNMIVVGFADNYGDKDISDKNGAAEYLYYFATAEGSILFTHDTTSIYNEAAGESVDAVKPSGYTSNALLRDLMGMNRYGVNSKKLAYVRASGEGFDLAQSLTNYRAGGSYDYLTAGVTAAQAFTMNAMRKMSFQNTSSTQYRVPYYYMVKDPANTSNNISSANGFGEDMCDTTLAVRLNVGQITQYPYVIDEQLKVATTHSQWYQLNMEDPDLTVWYTLEHPAAYGKSGSTDTSKVYAASPQDAASNYYIYSKGNIFYSGVGHSSTYGADNIMERKLFINTLIAAYRPKYTPPEVVITNKEAYKNGESTYTIRVPKEINEVGGSYVVEGVDEDVNGLKVTFKLVDGSLSTHLKCRIYYGQEGEEKTTISDGSEVISKIVNVATGEELSMNPADGYYISGLKNETEYYFYYPKDRSDAHPNLIFEARNDRKDESGFAYLKIQPQPLFMLD